MNLVSLLPAATEMLFLLGAGPEVRAVSHECDFPSEAAALPRATRCRIDPTASAAEIDRQGRRFFELGEPLYELELELLAELAPDWLLTQSQCEVCALPYETVRRAVETTPELARTQVFDLNPQSASEMLHDFTRLGRAIGREQAALQVEQELRARMDRVAAASAARSTRPRTVLIEWTAPLMIAGNWLPELIELAGGAPGVSTPGSPSRETDWAEVLAFDPEVIVIAPCGFDLTRSREELETLRRLPHWHELSAVRAGRVFPVDGNALFNRPGPRIVDSLELLAGLLSKPAA